MNDFDYEVKERKNLARNATAKRNGSKSKKCTLPSDYLTPAQKKKLNGEVKVYQMIERITYAEFKKYPLDKKREYLTYFGEKYNATNGMMAKLFGCDAGTLNFYLRSKQLQDCLKRVADNAAKKRFDELLEQSEWEEIAPVEEKPEVTVAKPVSVTKPVAVKQPEVVAKPPVGREAPVVKESAPINVLTEGEISMRGKGGDICNHLFRIFGDMEVMIDVTFSVIEK